MYRKLLFILFVCSLASAVQCYRFHLFYVCVLLDPGIFLECSIARLEILKYPIVLSCNAAKYCLIFFQDH